MRPASRLARTRVILIVVGAGLTLGISALGRQAALTAEREQDLLHQAVAARVFDELERELTELVRVEEARPFGHWRHLYVPNDQVLGHGLSTSPLAELPPAEHLVGYFQYDPDGTLRSPHVLGADEAEQNELTLSNPASHTARVDDLARLTHDITGYEDRTPPPVRAPPAPRPRPRPQPEPVAPVDPPAPVPVVLPDEAWNLALNNAAVPRQQRVEQHVQAPPVQVQMFAPTNPTVQDIAAPPPPEPRARRRTKPPPTVPDRPLDVVISPVEVSPGPEDTLRFARTVRIDTQTWVQGVVFRRAPLQRWLEGEALGSEPVDHVTLSWDAPLTGAYVYPHRFADPFADWTLHLAVSPAPTAGVSAPQTVLALTALAMLASVVGLFAAYRTAAASVAWADERDHFVSAVTHELKTPLTAIQMYAEMLADGLVDDGERRDHYHRTIHAEATRLGRLIDDVLQYSTLDAREGLPTPDGTAADAISRALTLAEAHPIEVHATIDEGVSNWPVRTDLVVQVLTNLVDNAAKFGEGSAVALTARRDAGALELQVADGGPGVEPSFLPHMFEPFVRSERARTQETRGTGLGLALARELVTLAGGRITAANRPPGGLVVTVTLPA